ncbi:MAG: glucosamine-6-phosphate deaminase [Planctomycetes bacterium]|nr:glucosamine-6-phosphate deaminase [Planctomycetota bacterium]
MDIIIRANPEDVAAEAYEFVAAALTRKPDLTIGLATGRTPLGLYRLMRESRLDFSTARFFNLDEFAGLGQDHPASFHRYLAEQLLRWINVRSDHVRLLRGDSKDFRIECGGYEQAIRSCGGIDVQILGVGRNGHIGFNEPGSSLGSRTRIKTLEAQSIQEYASLFKSPDQVPRFCLTMGVGTIMEAKSVLLLATGREKADIVQRMIEGPVTAEVPGTALQFHPHGTVVLDEEAAQKLARREYWKWVYQNEWRVGM